MVTNRFRAQFVRNPNLSPPDTSGMNSLIPILERLHRLANDADAAHAKTSDPHALVLANELWRVYIAATKATDAVRRGWLDMCPTRVD